MVGVATVVGVVGATGEVVGVLGGGLVVGTAPAGAVVVGDVLCDGAVDDECPAEPVVERC